MRQMTLLIFALILLFSTGRAASPNCGTLEKWVTTIKAYSEGVDLNNLDNQQLARLLAPAFHNEVFPEYFDKPYGSLTGSEKGRIYSKLISCFTGGGVAWIHHGIVNAFDSRTPKNQEAWNDEIVLINRQTLSAIEEERKRNREHIARQQQQAEQARQIQRERRAQQTTRPAESKPVVPGYTADDYKREAVEMRHILLPVIDNDQLPYSFSGYTFATLLQTVYDGNFTGFTPLGLEHMGADKLMEGVEKIKVMRSYEHFAYPYFKEYSKRCGEADKINHKEFISQYERSRVDGNGITVERSVDTPRYYYLRPQFYNDFKRMDFTYEGPDFTTSMLTIETYAQAVNHFPKDLERLFSELPCDSPVLKQLETNLLLAAKGKSSIQKLSKYVE